MASPSSAASSPHNVMQFLSSLLSQRGPNALPYSEDVKLLIRQHLLNLMQELPSLRAKPAPFVHNDGTSANLLQVEGTVPMTFHGVSYNIPVIIWLLESYPKAPPRVFVSPTKDMIIKRPHKHVDASVKIRPSSQSPLPPLCSHNSIARAPLLPQDLVLLRVTHPPRSRLLPGLRCILFLLPLIEQTVLGQHLPPALPAPVKSQLKQRKDQLSQGIQNLQQEKEILEQQLQILRTNTDLLGDWLKEQGESSPEFDVDDAFWPCDALSKQMLESTSIDLALEDILYSLDRAVQEGSIPVEVYLKQVRSIAREQFFHRAISTKVLAANLQSQLAMGPGL
ncbi:hypothetical protein L7F22_040597 [Adiantum nelumboides]|nr:hypothetical protein [Adiantum nelumboides]